jgi:FKBP-type peptidyl-prolyl cis-trans isomerase (trigger factor)
VLRLEKQNDFSVASTTSEKVERRLAQGFLLNSSAQRQGERVTAEEWRFMIQELEESLGGIYSILAHSLQLPLVRLLMARMAKSGKIPTLANGSVRPIIVTGLEALGRGNDLAKLKEFIGDAIQTLTPQVAQQYLNIDDYLQRLATGAGLDPTGLVKTQEEIQQMMQDQAQQQQTAQMMDLVKKLGPAGIKAATDQSKGQDNGGSDQSQQNGMPGPGA